MRRGIEVPRYLLWVKDPMTLAAIHMALQGRRMWGSQKTPLSPYAFLSCKHKSEFLILFSSPYQLELHMAYFNKQAQNSHDFEKIDVFISHEKEIPVAGSLEKVWLLHKALRPWHFQATVFMVWHSSS